jgi:hypothetical protein
LPGQMNSFVDYFGWPVRRRPHACKEFYCGIYLRKRLPVLSPQFRIASYFGCIDVMLYFIGGNTKVSGNFFGHFRRLKFKSFSNEKSIQLLKPIYLQNIIITMATPRIFVRSRNSAGENTFSIDQYFYSEWNQKRDV